MTSTALKPRGTWIECASVTAMAASDDESSLDLHEVVAVEPSPEVKLRVLASIGGGRFAHHAASIAAMFEVSVDRAHELLGLIERSASWRTQLPGVSMIGFKGGASLGRAECGFLRLAPGTTFPMHAHVGEEEALVLTGQVHDATNDRVLSPGEGWRLPAGTRHELVGQGDEPCICAVCARGGIMFGA